MSSFSTDLFRSEAFAGSVGLSLRWNILNYGRLLNNIRVQDARFQQRATEYQNAVLRANEKAENALVAFLKSQQRVKTLAESVDAAEKAVDMALLQYREGKRTSTVPVWPNARVAMQLVGSPVGAVSYILTQTHLTAFGSRGYNVPMRGNPGQFTTDRNAQRRRTDVESGSGRFVRLRATCAPTSSLRLERRIPPSG